MPRPNAASGASAVHHHSREHENYSECAIFYIGAPSCPRCDGVAEIGATRSHLSRFAFDRDCERETPKTLILTFTNLILVCFGLRRPQQRKRYFYGILPLQCRRYLNAIHMLNAESRSCVRSVLTCESATQPSTKRIHCEKRKIFAADTIQWHGEMVNVGSNHKSASSVLYRIVARRLIYLIHFSIDGHCAQNEQEFNFPLLQQSELRRPIASSCKQKKMQCFSTWSLARIAFFSLFCPHLIVSYPHSTRRHIDSYYLVSFIRTEKLSYAARHYHFSLRHYYMSLFLLLLLLLLLPLPLRTSTMSMPIIVLWIRHSVQPPRSHTWSCPIIYEY